MIYKGSCLCGNIRFEVKGEFEHFFFCHCKSCRKDTGSAHASNLFSTKAILKWVKGKKNIKTFNYKNSGHIKSFCPICGAAVPNLQQNNTLLVVPAGSLDSPIDITPTGHIYLNDKANWDEHLENVPKFDRLP